MIPQGLIYYLGISDILQGSFTLTHGVTPSQAVLYVPPQSKNLAKVGPLVFEYGGSSLTFPNCVLDRIAIEVDDSGAETWALYIKDRRWMWQFGGCISGYYNVRRGGSESIVKGTEKTPRELATLCLKAMGESRYDVSQMPDYLRPEIEWDYDLPAQALGRLCDEVGCRVVLRLDNSVAIVRAGYGQQLPMDNLLLSGGLEVDTPERPDRITIVTAPVRWQANLELEAVGKEADGQIVPIGDLSYAPDGGWQNADMPHLNCVANVNHRELAKESVFRWYRIKPGFRLPKVGTIDDLDRILPIGDRQVETMEVEGRTEPRPAWVYGVFDSGYESAKPRMTSVDDDLKRKPQGIYPRPFRLDRELGIVQFSEPVYRRSKQPRGTPTGAAGGEITPADLRLRVAVNVRDPETRGWLREEFTERLPGTPAGTQPRYIRCDDIDYHFVDSQDNREEVQQQAAYYLASALQEYQWETPASATYAGFRALNPDGAIQQVSWIVDGEGRAMTRAARNTEILDSTVSYQESRFLERLQDDARKRATTSRQMWSAVERGRA